VTLETQRTTCPRDCYDACGIVVEKREGAVTRVLGDPEHPVSRGSLCGKCALAYNGVFRDPDARLRHPLRRVGPKGGGRFERVSWDEALAEIAARLQQVIDSRGNRAILHTHYTGTCSLLAGEFPMRFFHRLGATEVDPDTICNNAGHEALLYIYGDSTLGFDPKSAADSACIVVWGANPSHSAPHMHKHWLPDSGAAVVVVDPVCTDTAKKSDLHLQPFPGSDAALAFAWMHVAARDGLCDRQMLADHALGWDELEPRLAPCTPEWGEAETGVPAALIEEAARLYARGPSLLWLGQGLQRQPRGGNAMRACASLPIVTGNLCRAGTGFAYVNGPGPRNVDGDYVSAPHLCREEPGSVSHMELASVLADPDRAAALVSWNMNVAASGPRQAELRRGLEREDLFTVAIDLFPTDTVDCADFVLPAASFLEFDDLVFPYFHLYVSAQCRVQSPPGEALPNSEIFRRLARAMGFDEPELFEEDRAILDEVLKRTGLGIDFETLRRVGTVDPWKDAFVPFADRRFPTPSGRAELASAAAEAAGHPRLPEPHADPKPASGRLRLLTPAGLWRLNDSYANDTHVQKAQGDASVRLHPDDANTLGIGDGDLVELRNECGTLRLRASLSRDVVPGVALSYKGRWPKLSGQRANVNVLNPGVATDMGESSSVHGVEVTVAPADPV
jgi:anaerobic selenocysteine-containing dehydrogenase